MMLGNTTAGQRYAYLMLLMLMPLPCCVCILLLLMLHCSCLERRYLIWWPDAAAVAAAAFTAGAAMANATRGLQTTLTALVVFSMLRDCTAHAVGIG